jgi:hypothetical protein
VKVEEDGMKLKWDFCCEVVDGEMTVVNEMKSGLN